MAVRHLHLCNDANSTSDEKRRLPPGFRVPKFLLSETLRLFFLRLAIASSIMSMAFAAYGGATLGRTTKGATSKWTVPGILATVFTTIHHIGTAFGPGLFPIAVWLDLGLTLLEFLGYLAFVVFLSYFSFSRQGRLASEWIPGSALFALVEFWTLALSIAVLLVLKAIHLMNGGVKLYSREPMDIATLPLQPVWKYPARALFGRRLWSENVPGEARGLSLLRGFLALCAVFALIGFGIHQSILAPVSEMGKTLHRTYRAPGLSWSTVTEVEANGVEFKVLLAWFRHMNSTTKLADAVTVTAQGRQVTPGPSLPQPVVCHVRSTALSTLSTRSWDLAVASCPPSRNQKDPTTANVWWEFPNFDIKVNYTGLIGPGPILADRVSESVRVYLGLTKDIGQIYSSTEPVSLFPGTSMLSVANIMLRQRLTQAPLATFGFETYKSYMVASIAQTIVNPFVPPENDTKMATLGFTLQSLMPEWAIMQDYRSKTVLSGLSALGGLGSLVSTVLAMMLGTSLARAVFRVKPNSPFGFLHSAEGIQKACHCRYPDLGGDIARIEKQKGLFSYLLDTLIDVETLGHGPNRVASETSGALALPSSPTTHELTPRGLGETEAFLGQHPAAR